MLERSWIGQRVSVRRAVRHPDGMGVAFSDVVGDLVALDAGHAVVQTRSELVEIPVTHVAVAKLVPPSTRDELELQAIIDRGWVAAEREQLGGWTLRASGGFSSRGNSVLALAPVGRPMDEALDTVISWYAARGLPARFQLPVEGRRLLDAELGERGWEASEEVHVLTRRLDTAPAVIAEQSAGGAGPVGATDTAAGTAAAVSVAGAVTISAEPAEDWFALYRGGAGAGPQARALLLRHGQVAFAELRVGGDVVAVGRGTVDDDWLGVHAVEVAAGARRRGLGAAVMAALHAWGVAHGARRAHLEVGATNAAALSLYERLGYRLHHDYRYRTAPDDSTADSARPDSAAPDSAAPDSAAPDSSAADSSAAGPSVGGS